MPGSSGCLYEEFALRIMHVLSSRMQTGIDPHVRTIAHGLRERGVDVITSPLSEGPIAERLRADGLTVRCPQHRFRGDMQTLWRLGRIAQEEGVDIVHTHGMVATFYGQLAAKRTPAGGPVVTIHSLPGKATQDWYSWYGLMWLIRKYNQHCLRQARRLIVLNAEISQLMLQQGIPEERLSLIPNTIDVSDCENLGDAGSQIRQQLEIPTEVPLVGFVGRLAPAKDPIRFIALAQTVHERHPSAQFLVVGDGPLMTDVRREVCARGLSSHVHLAGWQDSALSWIAAMDVLVLTSRTEADPTVVYEAMALGKPVIAPRVGSLPTLLNNGQTGLLTDGSSEMFDATHWILANPREAERMGECARQSIRQHIAQQDAIGKLHAAYHSVLAEIR